MHINDLIATLEAFLAAEGNMEIFIYDSHGDRIHANGIRIGCVARGRDIEDYAYFSDLE